MTRKKSDETGLTDKQERYCQLRAFNYELTLSECYKRSYDCKGMSVRTISNKAHELEKKPEIQSRIKALSGQVTQEAVERAAINKAYVLERHYQIDQMDFIEILNDDGTVKPLKEWPPLFRQYITAYEIAEILESSKEDGRIPVGVLKKIKFVDKLKNLKNLGEHVDIGAYSSINETKVTHKYESLSDDELKERIERLQKEIGINTVTH